MKDLGITRGEWRLRPDLVSGHQEINGYGWYGFISVVVEVKDGDGGLDDDASKMGKANLTLVLDAGNTAQKCGLLPSELLKQRNELLQACKSSFKTLAAIGCDMEAEIMKTLETAIKNAER
jgi:hypothetical protein